MIAPEPRPADELRNGGDSHSGLENRFASRKVQIGQKERFDEIQEAAKAFALLVARLTPRSREQSNALTNIELGCMWAKEAIARNE